MELVVVVLVLGFFGWLWWQVSRVEYSPPAQDKRLEYPVLPVEHPALPAVMAAMPKKRGRPKGSKNKPKD